MKVEPGLFTKMQKPVGEDTKIFLYKLFKTFYPLSLPNSSTENGTIFQEAWYIFHNYILEADPEAPS